MERTQNSPFRDASRILTRAEAEAIINAADNNRDKLLFRLLLHLGLRITEALSIRWRDVDLVNGTVNILSLKKKTKNYVVLPLDEELVNNFTLYQTLEPVFPDKRIFRITRVHAWRRCQTMARKAGIDETKAFNHSFRHAFAAEYARTVTSVEGIVTLKNMLRHTSADMTMHYLTSFGNTEARATLNKMWRKKPDAEV